MADKKFVRELNSLIRFDDRRRLKAPDLRPPIGSETGVAEIANESPTETPEYMYIRHFAGGLQGDPIYRYDKDGGSPVLVGQAGGVGGLGIYFESTYVGNQFGEHVYENGNAHILTGLSQVLATANSTHIVVQDDLVRAHRYLFNGTHVDTFQLPIVSIGAQCHAANDTVIAYTYTETGGVQHMALSDMAGVSLASDAYTNFSYQELVAAAKDVVMFVDLDHPTSPTEYRLKLYNNAGTLIATHAFSQASTDSALNGTLDAVGISSDRIYLFGRSSGVPNCLIYEHTLTIVSNLATNDVLGSLLHTVATPQNNNVLEIFGQATAIDGSLMV